MRGLTRRGVKTIPDPGQDSFLDIVANLVGILIILIMVIGARATDAMVDAAPRPEPPSVDVATPKQAADAIEADICEITARMQRQELEIAYRRKERDAVNTYLTAAQRMLDQQEQRLSQTQQEQFQATRQVIAARKQLEQLEESRRAVEHAAREPIVIAHLPTPLARTVFGKEIHFRLLGGNLLYVPWDELVERLKVEAPQRVWKLKDAASVTETIGPLLGFRLQYTLKRTEQTLASKVGVAIRTAVELDQFVLLSTGERVGEPLEAALRDGSEFRSFIDRQDPDRTTITVWVYPDSFDAFRHLRQALHQRGFSTAGRPLPEGFPIGGSPSGSRSAAQ